MHHHLRVTGLPPGNVTVKTGHTLYFYCDNGNPLEGPEEIQCLESGQWSSPFPKCAGVLTSQSQSDITFFSFVYLVQNVQLRRGDFSCYVNVPTKNCFFCQTEYCHVTRLPNNVIVNEIGRLPHAARQGQRLTFRCSRHGQVLHGANSVECLANGEWSHPFPTCGGKPVRSTRSL